MFWLAEVFNGSISPEEMQRYEQRARRERAEAFHGLLSGLGRGLSRGVAAVGRAMRARYRRRRTVRQLRGLDDHMLADIGLTRDDLYLLNRGEWPTRLPDAAVERQASGRPRRTPDDAARRQPRPGHDQTGHGGWQRAA